MEINNTNMPNPFLIIVVFAITLCVVRVFTILIHELGHALAGLLFLKGNFDIYIGSYGDPEKGIHFKIWRINFHFIYDPFSLEKGVFKSNIQETTHLKDFIITLAGPLASLLTAGLYVYLAIFSSLPEVVKISFYILMGSSLIDFWYNIKPDTTPIVLHDEKLVYNDGYILRYRWACMFNKIEQTTNEDDNGKLNA